ncbi:RNA polymerase sigma factor [Luteolibacter luteus]|uniref:Sigma-70 family RNA polymerase sigma factor n=1 Tax=Luteolibacter luteus TaxID=2728835 RepID=A0A858RKM5_9BACT|nr:sigma-70 family RNA polymerase sigma factor [Luteolibacter luteus]QJE97487.1 sigma-70 family RNA polymerase sigma factor [Luteolibacter luteus]
MPESSDADLLRQWQIHESETAFRTLVERYAGLVYKAALRTCGDRQLASEASQMTFITLARKAGSLSTRDSLAGWLHVTAILNSKNLMNHRERECRKRERLRYHLESSSTDSPLALWKNLEASLDEALSSLAKGDRELILLRHYRVLSMRDIAASLSITVEAAQKRVDRAMDRLRLKLGTQVGSAALATALAAGLATDAEAGISMSSSLATGAMNAAKLAGTSVIGFLPLLLSMKYAAAALVVLALLGVGLLVHSTADKPGWTSSGSVASAALATGGPSQAADQRPRNLSPARLAIQQLEKNYGIPRTNQARATADTIIRQASMSAEIFQTLMISNEGPLSLYNVLAMQGDLKLSQEQLAAADKLAADFMFRCIGMRRSAAEKLASDPAPLMELLLASDACSKSEIPENEYLDTRSRLGEQVAYIEEPVATDYVGLTLPAIQDPLLDPLFVKDFRTILNTAEQHTLLDEGVKTATRIRRKSGFTHLEPTSLDELEAKMNSNLLVMQGLVQALEAEAELRDVPTRKE